MRHVYLSVTVFLCLIFAGSSLAPSQIVSDDFNAYNLKTSLWTFTDPLGDAVLTLNGTGTSDATLSLFVPAGKSHELWTAGNTVPRIMQPAPNVDFDVQVKFQSSVSQAYQMQGVLVQQDSANLVRIEFNSAGGDVNLFAASFTNGFSSPATQINTDIGPWGPPLYLRIHRTGSTWVLSWSTNGTSWNSGGIFVHTMTVNQIGLFAGNSGGSAAPADTTIVDYFFNSAAPIAAEDSATTVADATAPLIYDVRVTPVPTGLRVDWKTDEPSTGTVDFGKTLSYEGGTVSASASNVQHTVNINNLTEGTLYNVRITANDNHPNNKSTSPNVAVVTLIPPKIDVWYGTTQTFGSIGIPQRNADILGNVSGQSRTVSLTYGLNGATPESLSMGPDGRLLQKPGDFKINLPYADLRSGANSVVITAVDSAGAENSVTVTVNKGSGGVWPLPYSVNWSGATSLTDSAQVVDGKWERTPQGIHLLQTGYDRAIAFGDTTWKNYELTAEITVNKIDSTAQSYSPANGGPALGFIFRWVGHTDQPTFDPPVTQPLSGYLPLGAFGLYSWRKGFTSTQPDQWVLYGNNLSQVDQDTLVTDAPVYGTKYILKMQVSTIGDSTPYYRLKFWPAAQAEPGVWLLNGQQRPGDPQYGSALLVAHYVDVTVGRMTAVRLGGDAIPPQIGNLHVEAGAHTSFITWATDELTTGKVLYGKTTSYGDTARSTGSASFTQALKVSGLLPSTTYHFAVIAVDTAGNTTVYKDSTFTTKVAQPPSNFAGDEFNGAALDSTLWTFVNPAPGGSTVSKQPTTMSFHVPGGVAHDLWTAGYQVPRIMQSVSNGDFNIEIEFDSPLSQQFQAQGLVIEQDPNNVIRLDFDANGTQTRIFAATFANGLSSPVVVVDSLIGPSGILPLMMRIRREDDIFTYSYSDNGATWFTVATFHHVMTVQKIGIFAGNAGANPPALDVVVDYIRNVGPSGPAAKISLKAILEGAYSATADTMRTRLDSVMSKTQPYNRAPWNYTGSESVTSLPAMVVDWVLVELRSDTAAATTAARRAGFLLKDGRIVDLDGAGPLSFPGAPLTDYFVVLRHRNHLAVMSAAKMKLDSIATAYDFTTGQAKAFGARPMKAVGTRFGLYAGDANGDGQVTSLDFDQFNPKFRSAATGYQIPDWNLDGQVTSLDFDLFNPNFRTAAVSRVPK